MTNTDNLSSFTVACSAAQISFFLETGGEIQWTAASKFFRSSADLRLLLSGLPRLIVVFAILVGMAWITAGRFYDSVDHILAEICCSFRHSCQLIRKKQKTTDVEGLIIALEERSPLPNAHEQYASDYDSALETSSTRKAIVVFFTTFCSGIAILSLQLVRPTTPPYAHMSGSLPLTLIEAALFQPIDSEFCLARPVEQVAFPWKRFTNYFGQTGPLDWMPQSSACSKWNEAELQPWPEYPENDYSAQHLSSNPVYGHRTSPPRNEPNLSLHSDSFGRSQNVKGSDNRRNNSLLNRRRDHGLGFDPFCDPLKLSNLDADVISALKEGLDIEKPSIQNILLLTLESTRKDMFPFKKDSHSYRNILSTHASPDASKDVDKKLRNLTNVATFLSGESNRFGTADAPIAHASWMDQFKNGMGGINVHGAVTQAAYTFKSLISSHCGVEPLPVDFTEETQAHIYQSCLPQVLDSLSNRTRLDHPGRGDATGVEDYRTWPWQSGLVQSITDQFDSQDVLDDQMGFGNVVVESTLSNPTSKHYPPKQPWVNYFGYPETESLDYLRDMFVDAKDARRRLFVSHITSTTHHPFATPKDWAGRTEYLGKQRWRAEDPLNQYLNTIKYQDDWISEIFQMLHEVGAIDETLIIITGDHGLAFESLD